MNGLLVKAERTGRMGKSFEFKECERFLKRVLKDKGMYSKGAVIAFLITGGIGFFAPPAQAIIYVETNLDTGAAGAASYYNGNGSINLDRNSVVFAPIRNGNVYGDLNRTAKNSVIIGAGSYAHGIVEGAREEKFTAVGNNAHVAGGQGTAIGSNTFAVKQATAVGNDVYAAGDSSIAIGNDDISTKYKDSLSRETLKGIFGNGESNNPAVAKLFREGKWYSSENDAKGPFKLTSWSDFNRSYLSDGTEMYSPTYAGGVGAIAIGSRSIAYKDGSTAIGTLSYAFGEGSTAMGLRAYTAENAKGAVAIGEQSRSFAPQSLAVGNRNESTDDGAMSYGYSAKAVGKGSLAFGYKTYANASIANNIAAADGHSATNPLRQAVRSKLGNYSEAQLAALETYQNKAREYYAKIDARASETAIAAAKTAMDNAKADVDAITLTDVNAMALVDGGQVSHQSWNTVGNTIKSVVDTVEDKNATNKLTVEKLDGVYLTTKDENGNTQTVQKSKKSGDNAIAIGYYASAKGTSAIAEGSGSVVDSLSGIGIGSLSYVSENSANSIAVGVGAQVRKENSIAIGTQSQVFGAGAIGMGPGSRVMGDNSIAMGYGTDIRSVSSIGLGVRAKIGYGSMNATGLGANVNIGTDAGNTVALGSSASIGDNSLNSMAVGYNANVANNTPNSIAFGTRARIAEGATSSLAVGDLAAVTKASSTALGRLATADFENSVALGYRSTTHYWGNPNTRQSNFSASASATNVHGLSIDPYLPQGSTLGTELAKLNAVTAGYVSVGGWDEKGADGKSTGRRGLRRIVNVAPGALDTDAVTVAQLRDWTDKSAHFLSIAGASNKEAKDYPDINDPLGTKSNNKVVKIKSNFDNDTATGTNALALGVYAYANGQKSVAMGPNAYANVDHGVAIGDNAQAWSEGDNGNAGVAIGKDAKAYYWNALALGTNSNVSGWNSLAFGPNARVGVVKTVDPTTGNVTNAGTSVNDGVAIGRAAAVDGASSIALGAATKITTATNAVAIGPGAQVLEGKDANNNAAAATGAVALGSNANVTGSKYSVALGLNSAVEYNDTKAKTTAAFTGEEINDPGNGVVSVGNNSTVKRRIINVASGVNDNDAVTVKQLRAVAPKYYSVNTTETDNRTVNGVADVKSNINNDGATGTGALAVGSYTKASGNYSTALGRDVITSAQLSTGIGTNVTVSGEKSVGIGNNVEVSNHSAVAIGLEAKSDHARGIAVGYKVNTNESDTFAAGSEVNVTGYGSVGIGKKVETRANNAVGIGASTNALGSESIALGYAAYTGYTTTKDSKTVYNGATEGIAVGKEAVVESNYAIAIGGNAKVKRDGTKDAESSVAIGAGAKVTGAKYSVALGLNSRVNAADTDTKTTAAFSGEVNDDPGYGVVSVGQSGKYRRILNVAGGVNDNDAVNVKQLRAAAWGLKTQSGTAAAADVTPDTNGKVTLKAGNNVTIDNANGVVTVNATGIQSVSSGNTNALGVTTTNGAVTITPNLAGTITGTGNDANKLVTAGVVNTAINNIPVTSFKADAGGNNGTEGVFTPTSAKKQVNITGAGVNGTTRQTWTQGSERFDSDNIGTHVNSDGRILVGLKTKIAVNEVATYDYNAAGERQATQGPTLSFTGLDMKNKKITNVADGEINATSKDAINGSQLHTKLAEKANVADLANKANVSDLASKLDKTAELHVKPGDYTVANNGEVSLIQEDASGTTNSSKGFKIKGLATKGDITNINTTLAGKADKSYVDTQIGTVSNLGYKANGGTAKQVAVGTGLNFVQGDGTANTVASAKAGIEIVAGDDGKVTFGLNEATRNAIDNAASKSYVDTQVGNAANKNLSNLNDAGKAAVKDLAAEAVKVAQGKNVTVTPKTTDHVTTYTVDAIDTTVAAGEGLSVTGGDTVDTATNARNYTVGLSADTKAKLAKVDNLANTVGTIGADGRDGKAGTGKDPQAADATAGDKGLTGKDGLNGKDLTSKVNALRNGEAGTVVYTDENGNRLAKANDGQYYPANKVNADGTKAADAVAVATPQARLVNPTGSTTTATKLSNIADGDIKAGSTDAINGGQLHTELAKKADVTALDGKVDKAAEFHVKADTYKVGDDGVVTVKQEAGTGAEATDKAFKISGLATKTDITNINNTLNNKANASDVEGLKTNPITFTGDDAQAVTRALGTTLTVKGAENFTPSATNPATAAGVNIRVEKDPTTNANGLVVKLADTLTNMKGISGNGTDPLTIKNGDNTVITVKPGAAGAKGDVDFGGSKLTNVGAPGANTDAANKAYVDTKFGNAANKDLGNLSDDGKNAVKDLAAEAVKVAQGKNVTVTPKTTDHVTTYTVDAIDTTVAAGEGLSVTGGDTVDTTTNVRNYTVGLSQATKDTLAKVSDIAKAVGVNGANGIDGRDGKSGTGADAGMGKDGLTKEDGLNGKDLTTKVNALRNGEAGTVVYTDENGKRVVKAKDGKWYLADKVGADGTKAADAAEVTTVQARLVNPDGTTTGGTTKLSNIADGEIAAGSHDAVTGGQLHTKLAEKADKSVVDNLTTTVNTNTTDIAGLKTTVDKAITFKGDDDQGVERKLDTTLTVKGATNFTPSATTPATEAGVNIRVEKDPTTNANGLVVKLADTLTNMKGISGNGTDPLTIKNGDNAVITVKPGAAGAKGDVDFGGSKLTNVGAPGANTDAANKFYVDEAIKAVNQTAAGNANLGYKANGGTAKTVAVTTGLDFVQGDGTTNTAEAAKAGIEIVAGDNGKVTFGLNEATRNAIDNAANKDLGNLSDNGKNAVKDLAAGAVKVAAGKNVAVTPKTTDHVTTYTVDAIDTTVAAGDGLEVTGGAEDTNKVRAYTVGLSADTKAKLAKVENLANTVGTIGADGRDGKAGTGKDPKATDAVAGDKGLTGQDGLNGKDLTSKVNALRNGEAGTVVYTDENGNRLAKANDGQYYPANKVNADGTKADDAVAVATPQARLVNPNGTTTGGMTKLSNIADGTIGENSKDAINGGQLHTELAKKADKSDITTINNTLADKANASDLNTLAEKPLTFSADTGTNAARKLGETLAVKGAVNFTPAADATPGVNIQVASDPTNGLTVSLADTLTNMKGISGNGTDNLVIKNGTNTITVTPGKAEVKDDQGTVTTPADPGKVNFGDATVTVKDLEAPITYRANGVADDAAKSVSLKKGLDFVAGDGTTATAEAAKAGLHIETGDNGKVIIGLSDDAKTKLDKVNDIAKAVGANGVDGRDGKPGTGADAGMGKDGLTAADGLNGKDLTTKVNALRNGEAGSVVYTDENGNRVVKANDGKWYPAGKVGADGTKAADATEVTAVQARLVNPDGTTAGGTTKLSNIADGTIGENSKDAINGGQLHTELAKKADVTALAGKANTSLDNLSTAGEEKVKDLAAGAVKVAAGKNVTVTPKTTDHVTTYTVDAIDTTVAAGEGLEVTGGTEDTNKVRAYTVGLSQATKDTLAKVGDIAKAVGANGVDGRDGKPGTGADAGMGKDGLTKEDGLNGKDLTTKVNALRNGEAGTVVYTDENGNRVVKANDGKWYPAGKVNADGTKAADATEVTKPQARLVNPDGTTAGGTTKLSNIADGEIKAGSKDAINGGQLHTELAKKADVTALNELADKPLTFSADTGTNATRKLGETLAVKGAANFTPAATATPGVNIQVASDPTNGLTVSLADTLTGMKGISGNGTDPLTIKNGDNTVITVKPGADGAKGDVDFGGSKLTNVGAPGVGTDAANKDYVDEAIKAVNQTAAGNANLGYKANGGTAKTVAVTTGLDFVQGDGTANTAESTKSGIEIVAGDSGKVIIGLSNDAKTKLDKVNDIAKAVGANGVDGRDGKPGTGADAGMGKDGLTAADGLNGKDLTTKVNALRNGEAGSVVYTDENGNRVVKATDGKWYPAGKVNADGTKAADATEVTAVQARLVNPDGTTTTAEGATGTKLSNIANGTIADKSKDAVNGGQLYTAKQELANALGGNATVGNDGTLTKPTYSITKDDAAGGTDTVNNVGAAVEKLDTRINTVKGLATQPLTFTGDDAQKVARTLGTELTVKGAKNFTPAADATAGVNIRVEKDTTTNANGLVVKLADTLTDMKGISGNGTDNLVIKNGTNTITVTPGKAEVKDDQGTVTTPADPGKVNFGDATVTVKDLEAPITYRANGVADDAAKSVSLKKGLDFVAGDGTTATAEAAKAGLHIETGDNGKVIIGLSDDAKTKLDKVNDIAKAVGANGVDGRDGKPGTGADAGMGKDGLTAADGLNGKDLTTKVNALRNGEAGSVVYTDENGNRVVKANDGKWYPADKVKADGTKADDAVEVKTPQARLVNTDGTTTGGTTVLNNVASAIPNTAKDDANQPIANPTFLDRLNTAAGDANTQNAAVNVSDLNNTAKDIIAKGLTFQGNDKQGIKKQLGETLDIVGEGTVPATATTAANNIRTKKTDDNKLEIGLVKDLVGITSVTNATTTDGAGTKLALDGNNLTITNTQAVPENAPAGTAPTVTTVTIGKDGINAGGKVISNVAAPKANTDAANKEYVDTKVGEATAAATGNAKIGYKANSETETKKVGVADGLHFKSGTGTIASTDLAPNTESPTKDTDSKEAKTGIAITTEENGVVNIGLDEATRKVIDSAAKLGDTATDGRDGKAGTGKAADDATAVAGDKGLTGQDGLNGKDLTSKVNALRNGEAGTVVYTDDKGNRVVKANDGKWYNAKAVTDKGELKSADQLPQGVTATPVDAPQARLVNPDGSTTTAEGATGTKLSNIADGTIGENSKDAINGGQLHTELAKKADVTALNELAEKALTFSADTGTNATRKLGTTLAVKGAANFTPAATATPGVNIQVASDPTNGLTVSLADTLTNMKGISGNGKDPLTIKNGDNAVITVNPGANGAKGEVDFGGSKLTNIGTPGANTDAANKAYVDSKVGDVAHLGYKANNGTAKQVAVGTGLNFVQGDGTANTVASAKAGIEIVAGDDGKVTFGLNEATRNAIDNAANKDLGNLSDNGKNAVKDLAAGAVTVAAGKNVAVTPKTTDHVTTYTVDAIDTKVIKGDGIEVTGGDEDTDKVRTYTVALSQATKDTLAKVADIAKAVGADGANGIDGRDGKSGTGANAGMGKDGLTGADGLNGKDLTTKVNALRNGEAGSVVYTDENGNRVVKASDGKWYPADKVKADGTKADDAVEVKTPQARLVNPDGSTTGGTTVINNVASAIPNTAKDGANQPIANPTFLDRLNTAAGDVNTKHAAVNVSDLNNTATEIIAKGLTFEGNDEKAVTRALGTTLTVKGAKNFTPSATTPATEAGVNIRVEKDSTTDANGLVVKLADTLTDMKGISGNGTDNLVIKNGTNTITVTPGKAADGATKADPGKVNFGDATVTVKDLDAPITYRTNGDADEKAKTVSLKQGLDFVTGDGTTNTAESAKRGLNIVTGENGKVIIGLSDDAATKLGKVDGIAAKVDAVEKALDNKADKSTVEDLANKLADKADKATVKDLADKVDGKADKSTVADLAKTVEGKADKSELDKKADKGEVTALANKAMTFTGNNAEAKVERKLGETLHLVGTNNITVEKDATKEGTLNVTLASTLTGMESITTKAVDGLSNTTWDPTKVASAEEAKAKPDSDAAKERSKAATQGQLKDVADRVSKGRVFTADTKVGDKPLAAEVGLGDTLAIQGGATGELTDKNIGVELAPAKDGKPATMTVKLAKDLNMADGKSKYDRYLPEFEKDEKGLLKLQNGNPIPKKDKDGNVILQKDGNGKPIVNSSTVVDGNGTTYTINNLLSNGTVQVDNDNKPVAGVVTTTTAAGTRYEERLTTEDGHVIFKQDDNTKELKPVLKTVSVVDSRGIRIGSNDKPVVSLTKDGLNNGGNTISNVAPGVYESDAATVGQLNTVSNTVTTKVNEAGAHAAALAAMNPLSYDPLKKSQVMAGVGAYKGNKALALGVAHYANEDTMFNVGVSVGGGSNMMNAGVTYRFGGEDSMIPERYKGGPISSVYILQDEVSALKAENAQVKADNEQVKADNARMKENYEKVMQDNEEMKAQIKMLMAHMGIK